ncbi:hypothetical protein IWQ60_002784 [Tieghemiomyces parasiticus]|uniref:Uncharacterized protein n=1 Tax=Tieghemiomyces parasiticus TaxID=78921 RepID=A0A9W8AGT6_9FUNG|nr:hypothetical protein IWQ60_002784 [Tieghemiomyces parasiticus]
MPPHLLPILALSCLGLKGALAHGPAGHSHDNSHDDHHHDPKDLCDQHSHDLGSYSISMGAAAILIMFVVSALGVYLPILTAKQRSLRIPPLLFELTKHFGSGIILATGFIHMFPGAIFNLTDPCLPPFFLAYSATAGLVAMVAALVFHLIELLVTQRAEASSPAIDHPPSSADVKVGSDSVHGITVVEHQLDHSHHHGNSHAARHANNDGHCCSHGTLFNEEGAETRRVSTYLLEFGIALHSILIGLALGTSEGPAFISLLAALCFHQFFEGLALGARITELNYRAAWMPFANGLVYAITTPLGTALGVIFRSVYRARSPTTLIVQGVLDAVSAGILLYTALVNLMAQEFTRQSFTALPRSSKSGCLAALYLGALAMSVVGIWV